MTSTMPTRTVPSSVMLPDDPAWDEARQVWNALVDQQPAAIAGHPQARPQSFAPWGSRGWSRPRGSRR